MRILNASIAKKSVLVTTLEGDTVF